MNRHLTPGLLALIATAAAPLFAQAPIVQTVLQNGTTQTRYDMVVLGDGYQAAEKPQFDQDVTTFLTALFQKQPYQTFAAYYNVHTVFRASVESGADRPDENPPVFKNTVYDATYDYGGTDRCLYIQNTSLALADAALAPANEGRVLVLVNDSRYGGCASTFAVSYNGPSMTEVQTHELGHSLGQLADEYDYPNDTYTGSEPGQVNATISPTGQKWSIWHGTDGISAFEGARYYVHGLYRPRNNCLMRSLGQALCRVCQENIVKITNSIVDVIATTSPATTSVTVSRPNLQQFSFTHFVPPGNNPLIEWRLDGNQVPGASSTALVLDSQAVALGNHTVTCSVLDQSDRVRSDPSGLMRHTHTWQVAVDDPTLAQLRLTAFTLGTVFVQPGQTLNAQLTAINDGPGAAGPFDVEFFLTDMVGWSTLSIYLGKAAIAGLAAGQSASVPVPLQVPWTLSPVLHYVTAVADRVGAIAESNEADNERLAACFGQAGPCVTGLQFEDPLTAVGEGTISLASGGVLHPTLVAPCANPAATLYLLAWGGAGTTPGMPLAPGVVLPLNPDGLTTIGLDGLNGAVFGGFLGVLDAQGRGHATFHLPPATPLFAATTHFAGVLLGDTQLFLATTNAVRLTLTP